MDAERASTVIDTMAEFAPAPQALLAVRVYVPVAGVVTVGSCTVDVYPPGPVQLHWVAPMALPSSVNVFPGHSVVILALALTVLGIVVEFTTTSVLAVAVHPLVADTVTVYVNVPAPYVVALNGAGDAPEPVYPLLLLQLYEFPPVAVSTMVPSVQYGPVLLAVAVGEVITMTTMESLGLSQPVCV